MENKIKMEDLIVSNESFEPGLKELKEVQNNCQSKPTDKKSTGSFNAGLKDLKVATDGYNNTKK